VLQRHLRWNNAARRHSLVSCARLLETVRQYGLQRLDEAGELVVAREAEPHLT